MAWPLALEMKILGLNSATARVTVSLVELDFFGQKKTKPGTRIIFSKSWDSNRDEAEKILPAVRAALGKGRPDLVFCVRGPGSFTSVRIGVTVANMLASFFGIKVAAVDTYGYLRARLPALKRKKTVLVLKAGGDFVALLAPGRKNSVRLVKSGVPVFLKKHPALKFAAGDMSAGEKADIKLPKGIKWLDEKELAGLPEVMVEIFAGKDSLSKRLPVHKMAAPKYMLPPKITKSKKPVFSARR